MTVLYEITVGVWGGLLISRYYGAFLKARRLRAAILGTGYLAARLLLNGFFELPGLSLATTLLLVLLLSAALFHADAGILVFLLFSFFAVQEISMFISICVFNWLAGVTNPVIDFMLQRGAFSSLEDGKAFINAFFAGQTVLQLAIYFLCSFITLKLIEKSFRHRERGFSPAEWLYVILPCTVCLSLSAILRAVFIKDGVISTAFSVLIPLAGLVCLVSLVGAVKLFQRMIDLRVEESENAVLRKQTAQLLDQVRSADDIYAEIKGMRHDIKNHAANISLLARSVAGGDELNAYLGKLEESLERFDFAFQTGNSISDVIIHQKYLEAKKNGVEFSSDFVYPADMGLDPYDLAVILSNALDNALEADTGFIRISSYRKNNMFFIEIENSFAGEVIIDEHTGLPQSGKEDKSAHGMGLSNIRRCARKHFGDINIETAETESGKVFWLTVMLQGDFTAEKP